jgi:transcriptional regulator with XRE-family HTH domain
MGVLTAGIRVNLPVVVHGTTMPILIVQLLARFVRLRRATVLTVRDTGTHVADLRRRAGLTQEQLAARMSRSTSWVSKVERGDRPLTDLRTLREVASALGVPVRGLIEEPDDHQAIRLSDEELQRRAFLAGLGVVAVGTGGADLLARLSGALDRPARLDAAAVGALRFATTALGDLYGRVPAAGLWGLARGHCAELTRLMSEAPSRHRAELASLAAEVGGVCAWLAADLDRQNDALTMLDTALRAATEAGDAALGAYLLASATVLSTFRERAPRTVVEVLTGESRGVRMTAATPSTAAWADTLRASAHARLGERDAALHALADAAAHLESSDDLDTCRPRRPFFDRVRLDGEHGVAALRLGRIRIEATMARLRAAVAALPPDAKIVARYTTALAAVLAEAGEVTSACEWAGRSLDAAADVPRSLNQVRGLRAGVLSRWPRHPSVRHLDDRLAVLAGRS